MDFWIMKEYHLCKGKSIKSLVHTVLLMTLITWYLPGDPEKSTPVGSSVKCIIIKKFSEMKHCYITNELI